VLGYPALRKVKPDFFMGIQTSSLRIALDLSTPAESVDPSDYLSKREGLGFLWEISQCEQTSRPSVSDHPYLHRWLQYLPLMSLEVFDCS